MCVSAHNFTVDMFGFWCKYQYFTFISLFKSLITCSNVQNKLKLLNPLSGKSTSSMNYRVCVTILPVASADIGNNTCLCAYTRTAFIKYTNTL